MPKRIHFLHKLLWIIVMQIVGNGASFIFSQEYKVTVIDSLNRKPIPGVEIYAGGRLYHTNKKGMAQVENFPGKWILYKDGYFVRSIWFEPGRNTQDTFLLMPVVLALDTVRLSPVSHKNRIIRKNKGFSTGLSFVIDSEKPYRIWWAFRITDTTLYGKYFMALRIRRSRKAFPKGLDSISLAVESYYFDASRRILVKQSRDTVVIHEQDKYINLPVPEKKVGEDIYYYYIFKVLPREGVFRYFLNLKATSRKADSFEQFYMILINESKKVYLFEPENLFDWQRSKYRQIRRFFKTEMKFE